MTGGSGGGGSYNGGTGKGATNRHQPGATEYGNAGANHDSNNAGGGGGGAGANLLEVVLTVLGGEDNCQQHIEILTQQVTWEHQDQIQEDSILQVGVPPFMVLLAGPDPHCWRWWRSNNTPQPLSVVQSANNGRANTGGGGAGPYIVTAPNTYNPKSGNGGSGIVLIAYPT